MKSIELSPGMSSLTRCLIGSRNAIVDLIWAQGCGLTMTRRGMSSSGTNTLRVCNVEETRHHGSLFCLLSRCWYASYKNPIQFHDPPSCLAEFLYERVDLGKLGRWCLRCEISYRNFCMGIRKSIHFQPFCISTLTWAFTPFWPRSIQKYKNFGLKLFMSAKNSIS